MQDFDLQNRSLMLKTQNGSSGSPQKLSYDLLVGADGVGSQVRPLLPRCLQTSQLHLHKQCVTSSC